MPELEQVVDHGCGGVLVLDAYLVDAKVLTAASDDHEGVTFGDDV